MKKDWQIIVAKKYAQAFLGAFKDTISFDDVRAIESAHQFLTKHKRTLFFLKLPLIEAVTKRKVLDSLCDRFELPLSIKKLINLLLEHKRSFLINDILHDIAVLYKRDSGILSFTIFCSHALSEHEIETIKGFLAQQTGCDIIYECTVDKKLIAGIRLQSNTLLWEHSIAKQLYNMRLSLIR